MHERLVRSECTGFGDGCQLSFADQSAKRHTWFDLTEQVDAGDTGRMTHRSGRVAARENETTKLMLPHDLGGDLAESIGDVLRGVRRVDGMWGDDERAVACLSDGLRDDELAAVDFRTRGAATCECDRVDQHRDDVWFGSKSNGLAMRDF